jgi:hypothetical protein
LRRKYEDGFRDGTWSSILPGRNILKRFLKQSGLNVPYEVLRNLILAKMVAMGVRPSGMEAIVNAILNGGQATLPLATRDASTPSGG